MQAASRGPSSSTDLIMRACSMSCFPSTTFCLLSFMAHRPPGSTLFPYTTLFRSWRGQGTTARATSRQRSTIVHCPVPRSEEHTSELQSHHDLVCRLLLEKKKTNKTKATSTQHSATTQAQPNATDHRTPPKRCSHR